MSVEVNRKIAAAAEKKREQVDGLKGSRERADVVQGSVDDREELTDKVVNDVGEDKDVSKEFKDTKALKQHVGEVVDTNEAKQGFLSRGWESVKKGTSNTMNFLWRHKGKIALAVAAGLAWYYWPNLKEVGVKAMSSLRDLSNTTKPLEAGTKLAGPGGVGPAGVESVAPTVPPSALPHPPVGGAPEV